MYIYINLSSETGYRSNVVGASFPHFDGWPTYLWRLQYPFFPQTV